MLQHNFTIISDADEEECGSVSEDGLLCVVHYPCLHLPRHTKVILLSQKSYNKLLKSKEIRCELEGEENHSMQCQGIPKPTYNRQRDGFHRPCFLKFVRVNKNQTLT